MVPLYNTPALPLGSALDAAVTLQILLARHTRASAQHATVIRGLLDLHRGMTRVIDAVPDLGLSEWLLAAPRDVVDHWLATL